MTLANTLQAKLTEAQAARRGRHTLVFTDPESRTAVQLDLEQADGLACQLWEIQVVPGKTPTQPLGARAEAMAKRVTGLLEPLKALEIDEAKGLAQLRSDNPANRDGDKFYYEVIVEKTGRATARRYLAAAKSNTRNAVVFTVTREALAKLVGDMSN